MPWLCLGSCLNDKDYSFIITYDTYDISAWLSLLKTDLGTQVRKFGHPCCRCTRWDEQRPPFTLASNNICFSSICMWELVSINLMNLYFDWAVWMIRQSMKFIYIFHNVICSINGYMFCTHAVHSTLRARFRCVWMIFHFNWLETP